MGLFSRSKQNENTEDNSQDTADSDGSPVDDSENSHTKPSEPEPIDTHAFVEDMRRKSEEIALSIASRFAERMDGIVEPIYHPNKTNRDISFTNHRAYSISNGYTKVVLFVRPFEDSFEYDTNPQLNLTPYQQSVRDTEEKMYKLNIRWFELSLGSDGSLSWDEFSNNTIKGDYDTVKNFRFTRFRNCQW